MSKISIIIPVYNCEKYLEQCLKSLISQTYTDIEILCINDGSTDSSLSMIEKFAKNDNRIKVFSQKNSGPATSRNLGLKNATGEYLMFCDSDDWYELNMCERMISTIIKEKVDFVECSANIHYETEPSQIRKNFIIQYLSPLIFKETKFKVNEDAKLAIKVLLWNKIFKTSLIKKYNITFPDNLEADDNAFIYQYVSIAKFGYGLKENLYNYLIRENSIMFNLYAKKNEGHLYDVMRIFDHIYVFLKNNNIAQKNKKFFITKFFRHSYYLYNDIIESEKERQEFFKIVKEVISKTNYKDSKKSIYTKIKNSLSVIEIDNLYKSKSIDEFMYGKQKIKINKTFKIIKFLYEYVKFLR